LENYDIYFIEVNGMRTCRKGVFLYMWDYICGTPLRYVAIVRRSWYRVRSSDFSPMTSIPVRSVASACRRLSRISDWPCQSKKGRLGYCTLPH